MTSCGWYPRIELKIIILQDKSKVSIKRAFMRSAVNSEIAHLTPICNERIKEKQSFWFENKGFTV